MNHFSLRSGWMPIVVGVLLIGFVEAQQHPAPDFLVGTWTASSSSTIGFQDRSTGSYAAPSGTVITHQIRPDGSFHTDVLIQSSLYQCTTTAFITEEGYVEGQGPQVTFHVTGGHVRSTDNCRPRWNYEKPTTPKQHVYSIGRVERTRDGQQLCLTGEDGKRLCLQRK